MPTTQRVFNVRQLAELPPVQKIPTGFKTFDELLEGGIVPNTTILLVGDRGTGKSTWLLQLLLATDLSIMHISTEEEPEATQYKMVRVLGRDATPASLISHIGNKRVAWISETNPSKFLRSAEAFKPDLLIIDSLQGARAFTPQEMLNLMLRIKDLTRAVGNMVTVTVCHVIKTKQMAGPKRIEHECDVIMNFSSDRELTVLKNRYGAAPISAFLKMTGIGVIENKEGPGRKNRAK